MPLDSYGTRFLPLPVSCSPMASAGASSSTTRDPPERRQLQLVQIPEGSMPPDELGLIRTVDVFGHGVVIRVADRVCPSNGGYAASA